MTDQHPPPIRPREPLTIPQLFGLAVAAAVVGFVLLGVTDDGLNSALGLLGLVVLGIAAILGQVAIVAAGVRIGTRR